MEELLEWLEQELARARKGVALKPNDHMEMAHKIMSQGRVGAFIQVKQWIESHGS